MYFDVKQSFLAQLKSLDIKPEDMIVSYKDEKEKTISFGDNKKFNEHSKLNLLGYRAGRGGLPPSKRHDILRFALKSGYMELYEKKTTYIF